MNLRPEDVPVGIAGMPSGNNAFDWYESVDLAGIVPHIAGVHLANLKMAEYMAETVGDTEFAQQCRDWFSQGSKIIERIARLSKPFGTSLAYKEGVGEWVP
jgi:hypothetical protein